MKWIEEHNTEVEAPPKRRRAGDADNVVTSANLIRWVKFLCELRGKNFRELGDAE
jgi:hypothetical protein